MGRRFSIRTKKEKVIEEPSEKGIVKLPSETKKSSRRKRISAVRDNIERILFGVKPLPDNFETMMSGDHTICDIHVSNQVVRIMLGKLYEELLRVDSKEDLDEFKHRYLEGLDGRAERQIPFLDEMVSLLEEHYAA